MKINALVGEFGEKAIIEAIEDMTDLNIDYYISLNFKGFRELVDVLGGWRWRYPLIWIMMIHIKISYTPKEKTIIKWGKS